MRQEQFVLLGVLVIFVIWTLWPSGSVEAGMKRKLLAVTHSAAFKHSVVTRSSLDTLSLVEETLMTLGEQLGAFDVTFVYSKEDCKKVTPAALNQYDGVFFYTTGDVPFPDDTKKALLEFVKSGKGFIGVHSATDTYYNFPEYGELIGGYFDGHPWHQQVRINVEDPHHPATRPFEKSFEITDEIYQFRHPWSRDNVRVLLRLDTWSVDMTKPGVKRPDRDFALAWVRTYGQGRVFYTALGHREEVWQDKRFQQHLFNGIRWAFGDVPADATPRPSP